MLFAARALAGILSSATLPTVMAYVGDSTSQRDRGQGMGIMGAAMGIGMVLGPGLGGWLATYSLSLPFFVASGLSLLVMILVYLLLPESLPVEQRVSGGHLRGPNFGHMVRALSGPMGYLLFLAFLLSFGMTNFEGVFGLYALERYGYGTGQVGAILTAIGLTAAVVQGGMTGPLTRRWGESRVIQGALLVSAAGFLLMLAAESFVSVLLTTCFFMVGNALLRPAVAALISKLAGESQGAAMGLNNSFMSLGRIIGPIWAGMALDYNLMLPYLSGALVMGIGFLTTLVWLTGPKTSQDLRMAGGRPQAVGGG
jgi:DHA1 family multidrug resistance protein-like MFS transporter